MTDWTRIQEEDEMEEYDLQKIALWCNELDVGDDVIMVIDGTVYAGDGRGKVKVRRRDIVGHDDLPDKTNELVGWVMIATTTCNRKYRRNVSKVSSTRQKHCRIEWSED